MKQKNYKDIFLNIKDAKIIINNNSENVISIIENDNSISQISMKTSSPNSEQTAEIIYSTRGLNDTEITLFSGNLTDTVEMFNQMKDSCVRYNNYRKYRLKYLILGVGFVLLLIFTHIVTENHIRYMNQGFQDQNNWNNTYMPPNNKNMMYNSEQNVFSDPEKVNSKKEQLDYNRPLDTKKDDEQPETNQLDKDTVETKGDKATPKTQEMAPENFQESLLNKNDERSFSGFSIAIPNMTENRTPVLEQIRLPSLDQKDEMNNVKIIDVLKKASDALTDPSIKLTSEEIQLLPEQIRSDYLALDTNNLTNNQSNLVYKRLQQSSKSQFGIPNIPNNGTSAAIVDISDIPLPGGGDINNDQDLNRFGLKPK